MVDTSRRAVLGGMTIAFAAGASAAQAADGDGHAAGFDVAPASKFSATIPRKDGDPVAFTYALDKGPIKATSGGWARDVTARSLPIATDIAGAHLYLNAGGVREMHWHTSDEWAYILAGHCQVTVVDPQGETEVANYGPGDLWYFPKGHSHAIQTLGAEPCHAILAFNDGLYGEHGTFGLSDWASRLDAAMMAQVFGMPKESIAGIPPGEVYIRQGAVMRLDGVQARGDQGAQPIAHAPVSHVDARRADDLGRRVARHRLGGGIPGLVRNDRHLAEAAARGAARTALAPERQRVALRRERPDPRDALRARQAARGGGSLGRRLRLPASRLRPHRAEHRLRGVRGGRRAGQRRLPGRPPCRTG